MQGPRRLIAPDSFAVAPELLGLPLASPARRAAAMLIDLLAIALLANAGGVFFGLAAAITLFRASAARPDAPARRWWTRRALRFAAAFVLFVTVVETWGFWEDDDDAPAAGRADAAGEAAGVALTNLDLRPHEMILLSADAVALGTAATDAEAQAAADRLVRRLRESGVSEARLAEIRDELRAADAGEDERIVRALRRAFGVADVPVVTPAADSLALAYAAALAAGDAAATTDLRPRLAAELARDELAALRRRNERLERVRDSLAATLEELREGAGLLAYLRGLADDLGLGFGWGGLYFTAFTALWRGQTPGKRLLRIRVIRLDRKPIGWWLAFERFGGYTAGLFTGLLGFAQVFWDRNRQAIHDKIVETVVIRDASRAGAEGPAAQQPRGGAQPAPHGALDGGGDEVVSGQR
ncbi:MAG TPA: RDD family protein [Longimicrobiales bacterium]